MGGGLDYEGEDDGVGERVRDPAGKQAASAHPEKAQKHSVAAGQGDPDGAVRVAVQVQRAESAGLSQ